MKLPKRKKRVFIDLEYINQHDLLRNLESIREKILLGVESEKTEYKYRDKKLLSSYKQWYSDKIHDYKEQDADGKTIFVVKSMV